jgi:hypothetical protein
VTFGTTDPDINFVLDSKTGIACADGFGLPAAKENIGKTTVVNAGKGVFIPYCADLYSNEDRVIEDFTNNLKQHGK